MTARISACSALIFSIFSLTSSSRARSIGADTGETRDEVALHVFHVTFGNPGFVKHSVRLLGVLGVLANADLCVPLSILVRDPSDAEISPLRLRIILEDYGEDVGDNLTNGGVGTLENRFHVGPNHDCSTGAQVFGKHSAYPFLLGLNLHFWHARQRRRAAGLDVGAFPAYRAQASLWSNAPS